MQIESSQELVWLQALVDFFRLVKSNKTVSWSLWFLNFQWTCERLLSSGDKDEIDSQKVTILIDVC